MNESHEPVAFEAARAAVLAACAPLESESLALDDAIGRVLAHMLVANDDLVPFARSAMDGFAVRASDARAGARLTTAGDIAAGNTLQFDLAPGTAIAIATGAAMPLGADAVVPIEEVALGAQAIVVRESVEAGDHVFAAGDDARAGDVLAARGTRVTAGIAALLAAAGFSSVPCVRRPRVAIVTTGDEVVAIEAVPRRGQIRNSNATLIAALVRDAGAEIVYRAHASDDAGAFETTVARARECAADLLVTSGGASVGKRDRVKAALRRLDARFAFESVAMRPGRPVAFATLRDMRALVLPGNPAAAFTGLQLFGLPALRALAGDARPSPLRVRARLRGTLHAKAERTYFAFVHLGVARDGMLEATPLDNQCSSLTRTAAGAAGFAVIVPGAGDAAAGEAIDVEVFPGAPFELGRPAAETAMVARKRESKAR